MIRFFIVQLNNNLNGKSAL